MTYFYFIYYIKKILLALLDTGVKYISKYCRTRIFKICRQAALFQKTYKDHKSYEDYFENMQILIKEFRLNSPLWKKLSFTRIQTSSQFYQKIFW